MLFPYANLKPANLYRIPILLLLLGLFSNLSAQRTRYTPDWGSLDSRPTPEWWQDAKFGIFIHWGVYSVPGFSAKGSYAEWYQHHLNTNAYDGAVVNFHARNYGQRSYYDLADDFKADLFQPDQWANLFEKAGAKYVVLTSKHHDGFCLWPSEEASKTWGFPWSADLRGPGRDLVGDLFTALEKTSVKPGLYYSLYEWYNPLWQFDQERYAQSHAIPQLHNLVETYQPWIIWADGDWDASPSTWKSPEFLAWLYNDSPIRDKVVVNDRWGSGVRFKHGGIYTPEYQPDMDFEDHPWEESRGMGFSYGYNRLEDAWDYNSAQALVLHLIDKVSRGGNFLLDIGPDGHGKIPPIMQERLLEIGKWLDVNGEAIYNTRRWRTPCQWSAGDRNFTFKQEEGWKTAGDALLKQTVDPDPGFAVKEFFYTWNPKTKSLYAVFPKYPANRRLVLKGIQLPSGTEVTLLATGDKLKWENSSVSSVHLDDRPGDDFRDAKSVKPTTAAEGQQLVITLPEYNADKLKAGYAYVVKIANYGAFLPKPTVEVKYDTRTMVPTVTLGTKISGAVIRYTLDGSEPRENSPEYKQPFSPKNACKVKAKAFKLGTLESASREEEVKVYNLMPSLSMYRDPAPGLTAQLVSTDATYNIENVERGYVEKSTVVSAIELDPVCTTGKCGMVWKGYVKIPQNGGYKFWTASDDGSMLYIDGVLVVDNNGEHGTVEKSGMANLQSGWHQVKIVYFNSGGGNELDVSFAPLGGNRQAIPAEALAH